jgi:glycosyltransferase involved in cell wall biosynthesis
MSATPRVSVIVTVYQRTCYLAEALDSVLAQSYTNYEIIVADDSGTAAAREIVAARGNPGCLRYLQHPSALGIAGSLVRAAEQARGSFLAILNDDDVWEPTLLARLVAPLEADPECVLAFSDHSIMDEKGRIDQVRSDNWSVSFGRSPLPEGVVASAAKFIVVDHGVPINISSVFRRDAFDWSLVVPEVTGAYDYWISCLLAAARRPVYYVPERLARYRVHPEMETRRRDHDKANNLVYMFSTLRKRGWFPELDAGLRAELAEALFTVGRDKLHFGRTREARKYLWRCFLLSFRLGALGRATVTFLPSRIRAQIKAGLDTLRGTGHHPADAKN